MKKLLLSSLLLSPLLFSCGTNSSSSSATSTTPESTDTGTSTTTEDEFITVEWNKGNTVGEDISTSGTFIDVAVKIPLVVGSSYSFGFTYPSGDPIAGSEIKITDNGVASLVINDDGSFNLTGEKQGETILYVYGADGFLHYRDKLTFRNPLSKTEMLDFIVNKVDHYESQFIKGMDIYFTSKNSGQIIGMDESTTLANPITFSFEYNDESNDEYEYRVTNYDNSSSGSTVVITTLYIMKHGYVMHPVTANTLVDFFFPVFEEQKGL